MTKLLQKHELLVTVLVIVLLSLATYSNIVSGEFLMLDDHAGIRTNDMVKDFGLALKTHHIDIIQNALLYKFFGMNSHIFHFKNILIHTVNSVLLFFLVRKLFGKQIGFASALLFVVHPINSEAVSWLSAAGYLVGAFFTFLILYLYIQGKDNKKYYYWAFLVYVVYVLLTMTPWVVTVPLTIFVFDIFVLNGKKKLFPVFFIPAVLYAGLTIPQNLSQRYVNIAETQVGVSEVGVILEKFLVLERSVSALFFPFKLSVYPEQFSYEATSFITIMLSIIFLLFLLFKIYKSKMVLGIFLCMYTSVAPALVPLSISVNNADRYFYVSSAFFSILLALLLFKVVGKYLDKKNVLVILVLILAIFFLRTFIRTFDWLNEKTLWAATSQTVSNAKAFNNLGNVYLEEKDYTNAIDSYTKALELRPSYPLAMYNLGATYYHLEDYENALKYFYSALKLDPNFEPAKQGILVIKNEKGLE